MRARMRGRVSRGKKKEDYQALLVEFLLLVHICLSINTQVKRDSSGRGGGDLELGTIMAHETKLPFVQV